MEQMNLFTWQNEDYVIPNKVRLIELFSGIGAQHEKELEEEAQRNQLNWKIEELYFSCRTYNCLKRAGVNTVGELVKLDDFDLMRIRNLGKKCMKEIKTKLEDNGFKRVGE